VARTDWSEERFTKPESRQTVEIGLRQQQRTPKEGRKPMKSNIAKTGFVVVSLVVLE
jgi:hypothetical protein